MIPSANTAKRVSAPPENRSMNDRNPVWFEPATSVFRAWTSMTGTGMWEPKRNTAMMNRVNRIFLRRSGILKALTKAFSTAALPASYPPPLATAPLPHQLGAAAGLLDLDPRPRRERVRPDHQGAVDVPPRQHLDREALADQAAVQHVLRAYLARLERLGQALHVDHRELLPVGVGEALQLGD